MRASLVLLAGGCVTLLLFGAFLAWRWYGGSPESGCELNWGHNDAQLACGSTLVSRTLWCEADWSFVLSRGLPPAGYCVWIP